MSKKKAASKPAASKKSAASTPKKVNIAGFDRQVDLKKEILKPLSQQFKTAFSTLRPGQSFDKSALKTVRQEIKTLAADGKLGKKDLAKIQKIAASGKGGKAFEPQLLSNATGAAFTTANYQDFTKGAQRDLQDFRKGQTGIVNQALQQQVGQLQKMLGAMERDARSALGGFRSDLNASMKASSQMLKQQRQEFKAENRLSERNIRKFQSRIAELPSAPSQTAQIGTDFNMVSAGSPFATLRRRQAPIQVESSPALTGFSTQQRESQARQIQGLSGFRSSRA
jgi:hypothetical protein